MKRRNFLKCSTGAICGTFGMLHGAHAAGDRTKPNILFITVDDMNFDSVGTFGCKVPDTTPNIDRLASEGIRFTHGHVVVGNCVPSRNVMQTGRYPHNSGVEGFYQVKNDYPILADILKEHGYFTAIKGKVSHSTPFNPYEWDLVLTPEGGYGTSRDPDAFGSLTEQAIMESRKAGKPFYLLMNINDPHKPFYGMNKRGEEIEGRYAPTRTYTPQEITVPGFLPDFPIIRKELAHYYSTVRRADDSTGNVLRALKRSGAASNTVVIFLSDHGMPFPFAKTNVYRHSSRTPWVVRWPGTVKPGTVDDMHMISAVDFMPTILDIVGAEHPGGLDGRSFLPLLRNEKQDGRGMIFKEYNENSAGGRHPMRSVETRKYGYIFNPWSNGTRKFKTATMGTLTYKKMMKEAENDKVLAQRIDLFNHRVREEFYDYESDPDALNNLIDNPEYREEISRLRKALEQWMIKTGDHALAAFRNRDNDEVLEEYMTRQEEESKARKENPDLRRGGNKSRKKRTGPSLVKLSKPARVTAGEPVTVTVHHTIPPDLGKQLVHVTIKQAGGKKHRIAREVLTAEGSGDLKVTFRVPDAVPGSKVCFAAFIGPDYKNCLQHIVTGDVPLQPAGNRH